MTAFLEAGFPPDTWIQKLEDFDSGSMLDEFIAGVKRGDANAQLMSARSDTGRSAWHKNAVASWLKHTGHTDHSVIAGVVTAFESTGQRPDKWVAELERMQKNGELKVFLDAVSNPVWAHEQLLASASRRRSGNGSSGTGATQVNGRHQQVDTTGNRVGSQSKATRSDTDGGGSIGGVVLESGPKPSSFRAAGKAVIASQRLTGPPAMNQRGTIAGRKPVGDGPPPVPKGPKGKVSKMATVAVESETAGQVREISAKSAGEDSMLDELGEIDGLSSDEDDSMLDEMAALDGLMDSDDDEEEPPEQQSEADAASDDELDMLDGLDDMLDGLDDSDSD